MSEPASLPAEPATDDTVIVDSTISEGEATSDLPDPSDREMARAAEVEDAAEPQA